MMCRVMRPCLTVLVCVSIFCWVDNVASNPSVQFEYAGCAGGYAGTTTTTSGGGTTTSGGSTTTSGGTTGDTTGTTTGGSTTGGTTGDGTGTGGTTTGGTTTGGADETCGNGKCLWPETCSTCVDDCGPCQTVGRGSVTRQCVNPRDWALTFDDGPSLVTDDLLDTLKLKGAKASFFVVGDRISWSAATYLQRAQAQGHYIARLVDAGAWCALPWMWPHTCSTHSHSYSHRDLTTMTLDEVREDLVLADLAIQSTVCVRPRVLRPPYGSINDEVRELAEQMGYRVRVGFVGGGLFAVLE